MSEIVYRQIGVVRSPFTKLEGMPLQSVAAADVEGTIEIHPDFVPGLLVDGTPVLDLKPYVPIFDRVDADRSGWFEGRATDVHRLRADARFQP
jgi:tRNA (Thr-GGU) A37 N-methylase